MAAQIRRFIGKQLDRPVAELGRYWGRVTRRVWRTTRIPWARCA